MKRIADGIKHLEESLNKPLAQGAVTSVAAEIRTYCRSLSDDKRRAFIADAFDRSDTLSLSAVLGSGAPYLAGLSSSEVTHWTRKFNEREQPELARRLKVMKRAHTLLLERRSLVTTEFTKALGADKNQVVRIREAKNAADAAIALLNPVRS